MGTLSRMGGVEIWDKINESAKIALWPGVVLAALVMFRGEVKALLAKLKSIVTPVGTANFDEMAETKEMTEEIAEPASRLLASVESGRGDDQSDAELGAAESAEPSRPSLLDLRQEVESIIQASFATGYDAGVSGSYKKSPTPSIQWTGSMPEVIALSPADKPGSVTLEVGPTRKLSGADVQHMTRMAIDELTAEQARLRQRLHDANEGSQEYRGLLRQLHEVVTRRNSLQAALADHDARSRQISEASGKSRDAD